MTVPAPSTSRMVAEADLTCAHTVLGCLVREVAGPDRQVGIDADHLLLRLPHIGALLRARLRRVSTVAAHRFTGPVERLTDDRSWEPIGLDELVSLVEVELTARTGTPNPELAAQVRASRDTLASILETRPAVPERSTVPQTAGYVDSEQALLVGHPRHPAAKWRSGAAECWRRYSPETRTAFPLRWLAVPDELVVEDAADGDFDGHAGTTELLGPDRDRIGAGRRALPVHPWQFRLLSADPDTGPVLAAALADGTLRDLGEVGAAFHPTASVRTLYQPEADVFLKTSLNVRITNCLRKNAAYELSGAVALTRVLAGPVAAVRAAHLGFDVLPEPAARSVALPAGHGTPSARHAVLEGLGCIVRSGLVGRFAAGEQVHLAATLAAPDPDPVGTRTRLADLADPGDPVGWARRWWRRYLELLVPPVLALWARHGVVLEPHLQNVLVVTGPGRLPVRVLARDLEGTKLLTHRHAETLAALPSDVAEAAAYDEERGWNRTAYCLFVNHLAEIAGALADLGPQRFEDELWDALAVVLAAVSADLGEPPRLRALLAGVPLPAKANLLIRWARRADRHAGYVPFPNPFGSALPEEPR